MKLSIIVNGFYNLNKQKGCTSRDVVNQLQRLARGLKVGHAGTLDPLATGVLVVAVGRATRLISYVQQLPKHYRASFRLGQTSDTEDTTGVLEDWGAPQIPSMAQVEQACGDFVGQIEQRPPVYSALKVAGKRAYDLARQGITVELSPRSIVIHAISVRNYSYPWLELDVECGSGTYIRSLGRDIGERLRCGAVMSDLCRMSIGPFAIDQAHTVGELLTAAEAQRDMATSFPLDAFRLPPEFALTQLRTAVIGAEQLRELSFGRTVALKEDAEELAGVSEAGELIAVLLRTPAGLYRPTINFATA